MTYKSSVGKAYRMLGAAGLFTVYKHDGLGAVYLRGIKNDNVEIVIAAYFFGRHLKAVAQMLASGESQGFKMFDAQAELLVPVSVDG